MVVMTEVKVRSERPRKASERTNQKISTKAGWKILSGKDVQDEGGLFYCHYK